MNYVSFVAVRDLVQEAKSNMNRCCMLPLYHSDAYSTHLCFIASYPGQTTSQFFFGALNLSSTAILSYTKDIMNWYGKEYLNPKRTNALVKKWQSPPGNVHDIYYKLFPELYPKYLPEDHYIVKYDETLYPKDRDYRTFKSAPILHKSSHMIEWEDGYGPCNVCEICIDTKKKNDELMDEYHRKLKEWKEKGIPM